MRPLISLIMLLACTALPVLATGFPPVKEAPPATAVVESPCPPDTVATGGGFEVPLTIVLSDSARTIYVGVTGSATFGEYNTPEEEAAATTGGLMVIFDAGLVLDYETGGAGLTFEQIKENAVTWTRAGWIIFEDPSDDPDYNVAAGLDRVGFDAPQYGLWAHYMNRVGPGHFRVLGELSDSPSSPGVESAIGLGFYVKID